MAYFDAMRSKNERLRQSRIDAGYRSARDAAAALDVKYSTYAGHENGARDFDAEDAQRYARRFGVPLEWLLTGRQSRTVSQPRNSVTLVPVSGIVRAGTWQEAEPGGLEVQHYVPSALDTPAEWQYAYTVEGTSLNKIANPGDTLICLDLIKSATPIEDNDLVIVERLRFGGQMLERTAKRVRRTTTGFELWPESNDPLYQEPIHLDGGDEHDETTEIRVSAKVLWILKKP